MTTNMNVAMVFAAVIIIAFLGIATYTLIDTGFECGLCLYILVMLMLIFMGVAALIHEVATHDASKRGHEDVNTGFEINALPEILKMNEKNHIVETEYEPKEGAIVIYVKYGCSNCMNTYVTLHQFARENSNIHFISSRSKIGKKLRKEYPTQVVPSAVVIGIPGKAWDLSNVNKNKEVLDELLELRSNFYETSECPVIPDELSDFDTSSTP